MIKPWSLARSWAYASYHGAVEPLRHAWRHRRLILMLARRDIAGRTSGTVLGAGWLLLAPGLQIFGFWFLLDVVMKIRYNGGLTFLDYFLIGMLNWFFISEVLSRSLSVYHEFASIYQRTPFPLAILPLVPLSMAGLIYALVTGLVSGLVAGWAAVPLALLNIAVLALWLIPLCYLLSVIGVFVKDLGQIFPFFISLVMYLTPILYTPDKLPDTLQWLLVINPVADLMALIHATIQDLPWTAANVWRPLLCWLLLIGPAWALFRRAEGHIREML